MVIFYNQHWVAIGTKETLKSRLSSITGIGVQDFTKFKHVCVARKMPLAAKRKTTRIEDIAYCLMGLFGINMPTLYGEGDNAFLRLQLEILSSTDDESIFAWTRSSCDEDISSQGSRLSMETDYLYSDVEDFGISAAGSADRSQRGGLLASSPSDFSNCGDCRLAPIPGIPYMERALYSMTNKGLRMEHLLTPFITDTEEPNSSWRALFPAEQTRTLSHQFLSVLHCKFESEPGNIAILIFQGWGSQPAERITDKLYNAVGKKELSKKTFYIKQSDNISREHTQTIPDNAILLLSDNSSGESEKVIVSEFWASCGSATLRRGHEGNYKLSEIPSESKGLKAIIAYTLSDPQFEFVIYVDWLKGPRAQVMLRDPRLRIDQMVSQFSVENSSERVLKLLIKETVKFTLVVAIRPALVDDENVYKVDIKISPPQSQTTEKPDWVMN